MTFRKVCGSYRNVCETKQDVIERLNSIWMYASGKAAHDCADCEACDNIAEAISDMTTDLMSSKDESWDNAPAEEEAK